MISIETSNYWVYNNEILVFKPDFDESLDKYIDIISQYDKLIFSDYDNVEICIKTNNINEDKYKNYYKIGRAHV